jgi:hypothetical protein
VNIAAPWIRFSDRIKLQDIHSLNYRKNRLARKPHYRVLTSPFSWLAAQLQAVDVENKLVVRDPRGLDKQPVLCNPNYTN